MPHLYALGATLVIIGLASLGVAATAAGIVIINLATVLLPAWRRISSPTPRLAHWPEDLDIAVPDLPGLTA